MKYINEFVKIKETFENYWSNKPIDKDIYGFQIQEGTKWKQGLSEKELFEFQNIMGFEFPEILRDYYTVMNGTDKDQINVYGDSGEPYSYSKQLYSYPNDVKIINGLIQWIYKENGIKENEMVEKNISRIFPIYSHRFMLIDQEQNPILSMYGHDIILFSNNIIDLFFEDFMKLKTKSKKLNHKIKVNFWLE